MSTFLSRVAEHIIAKHSNNLERICVVLPNRRSHIFLQRELSVCAKKSVWSPTIFSIEDFVFEASQLTPAEPITLLFELYELYCSITGTGAQPFEEFSSWGETLLKDFNDIDHYLIDSKKLYGYLNEAKAIERWGEDLSENETTFLKFYSSFETYYSALVKHVLEEKKAWTGLACRQLTNRLEQVKEMPYDHFIFAGFNALTAAEEKLISYLELEKKATILWDYDHYYMTLPKHEAGRFAHEHQRRRKLSFIGETFKEKKEIEVIGIPRNIGQVEYAVQTLKKIVEGKEVDENGERISPNDIAIVLNESILAFPLIASMPPEIGKYNLTMGLPFKLSALYGFLDQWFIMQLNQQRLGKSRANSESAPFYLRDITKLLSHPYLSSLVQLEGEKAALSLKNNLAEAHKNNRVFLTKNDVAKYILTDEKIEHLLQLFKPWDGNSELMMKQIQALVEMLITLFCNKDQAKYYHLDREFLFDFNKVMVRATDALNQFPKEQEITARSLSRIILQLARQISVPFKGEPLEGVQIMGMLETRALDFKYVIMLSTNEGSLPSTSVDNSFIPFDIKNEFHLPTTKSGDAIMSYHFYRLLQGCKKAWLLYNTESDALGGGDRSRFLTQIQSELPNYNSSSVVNRTILAEQPKSLSQSGERKIDKKTIETQLLKLAERGLSPSSLNNYISCPLRFCFQNVMHIKPPEEAIEQVDSSLFGSVVHGALEKLYNQSISSYSSLLKAENYQFMLPKIEETVESQFAQIYAKGDISHGKNYLIKRIACRMIENFLKFEKDEIIKGAQQNNFTTYLKSELELRHTVTLTDLEMNCTLKGFVDRVEMQSGIIRILDYKTGFVDKKKLDLASAEFVFEDPALSKLHQLIMYAYLYRKTKASAGDRISSGIIPLKRPKAGTLFTEGDGDSVIPDSVLKTYEDQLKDVLHSIFEMNTPFEPTADREQCKYCDYKEYCNR